METLRQSWRVARINDGLKPHATSLEVLHPLMLRTTEAGQYKEENPMEKRFLTAAISLLVATIQPVYNGSGGTWHEASRDTGTFAEAAFGYFVGSYPNSSVLNIDGAPLCNEFSPRSAQLLQFTKASTSNSCYISARSADSFSDLTEASMKTDTFSQNGNARFKESDLHYDIRQFGARGVNISGKANCTSGSPTVTLGGAYALKNSDYVVIYGCGPSNTASAPPSPTVNTGLSTTQQVPDATLARSTGSSTYSYLAIARDAHGGLSPAGSPTTITDGITTLGPQTVEVTKAVLSGNTLTVTCSATCALPVNTLFHFWNSSNAILSGRYQVASAHSGTTFNATVNQYTPITAPITVRGGTITWMAGNQISFASEPTNAVQMYVCAERPGDSSYHVIGAFHTKEFPNDLANLRFTDWGSRITSKPNLPGYITDSLCSAGSPTNDMWSAQIQSGAGTSTLTMTTNAPSSASNQTIYYDDGPAVQAAFAAAKAAHGVLYFPVNFQTYIRTPQVLNAYESAVEIKLAGIINLTETFESVGNNWRGMANRAFGSFSYEGNSYINCTGAWPCFLSSFDQTLEHFGIVGTGNQNLLLVDNDNQQTFNFVNLSTAGSADYSGIAAYMIPGFSLTTFNNCSFTGGPPNHGYIDSTWVPLVYFATGSSGNTLLWRAQHVQISPRNFYTLQRGSGTSIHVDDVYNQGAILPNIAVQNLLSYPGLGLELSRSSVDTSTEPSYAVWGTFSSNIELHAAQSTSQEAHGYPLPYTGGLFAVPTNAFGFTYPSVSQPAPTVGHGYPIVSNGYSGTLTEEMLSGNRTYGLPDTSGLVAVNGGSSPTAYDNFNRTDGAIGSNWTVYTGGFKTFRNVAVGTAASNVAVWTGSYVSRPGAAAYAQATVTNIGASEVYAGVVVNYSPAGNGYQCYEYQGLLVLQTWTGGSMVQQVTTALSGSAGDTVRLTYLPSGTNNISCSSANTAAVVTTVNFTNTRYPTGSPGIVTHSVSAALDNWSGGYYNSYAALNTEQDWTQPQHYPAITVGPIVPGGQNGTLPAGSISAGVLNQAETNKYAGTCVFTSSTTCRVTFSTPYAKTPIVIITPVNPDATTFKLTSTSNRGLTITASGSTSVTVNWVAIGNPN